jgi:hypothetical protein
MPVRQVAIAALVLAATITASGEALACKCDTAMRRADAIAMADAVFTGRVLGAERSGNVNRTRFAVETMLKGALEGEIVVLSPAKVAACGISFAPGSRVTVAISSRDGGWSTRRCINEALRR